MRRAVNNQKSVIEAPLTNTIINQAALDESDRKLLKLLKTYLLDMLDSSYCPMIEQVFNEISKNSELLCDFDKYHYFKISSFMIQICRLRAYEDHLEAKKKAYEEAKLQ
jgi:hypothetical protein